MARGLPSLVRVMTCPRRSFDLSSSTMAETSFPFSPVKICRQSFIYDLGLQPCSSTSKDELAVSGMTGEIYRYSYLDVSVSGQLIRSSHNFCAFYLYVLEVEVAELDLDQTRQVSRALVRRLE